MKYTVTIAILFAVLLGFIPAAQAYSRTGEVVRPNGAIASEDQTYLELKKLRNDLIAERRKQEIAPQLTDAVEKLAKNYGELTTVQGENKKAIEDVGGMVNGLTKNVGNVEVAVHTEANNLGDQSFKNTQVIVGAIILVGLLGIIVSIVLSRKVGPIVVNATISPASSITPPAP